MWTEEEIIKEWEEHPHLPLEVERALVDGQILLIREGIWCPSHQEESLELALFADPCDVLQEESSDYPAVLPAPLVIHYCRETQFFHIAHSNGYPALLPIPQWVRKIGKLACPHCGDFIGPLILEAVSQFTYLSLTELAPSSSQLHFFS